MAPFPWPGDGSRRSNRKIYDDASAISEDSSMVSSITRQSMGTNQNRESMPPPEKSDESMQHPVKCDVEGGVPVEGPLSTTLSYNGPSFRERLSFFWHEKKELIILFWHDNKKLSILGGIGVLLIVFVVVISVTVSGKNGQQSAVPARNQAMTDIMATVSSSQSLSDPASPQYKAKEWMINVDPLQLIPSETVTDQRILQRYVLAVFYFATGGPDFWNPNSWMAGDECSGQFWIGLSCDDNDEVRAMAFGKSLLCFILLTVLFFC